MNPRWKTIADNTPSGTEVLVLLDSHELAQTSTRSKPWRLGSGELVVLLDGFTGGYSALRCFARSG